METRSSWGAAPLHPPTRGPGNGKAPCVPHGKGARHPRGCSRVLHAHDLLPPCTSIQTLCSR